MNDDGAAPQKNAVDISGARGVDPSAPIIRAAKSSDLRALVEVEYRCFDSDRITPRAFRYLLTKGRATTLIAEIDGRVAGYIMVLHNAGTSLARLYSFAVLPEFRSRGVGGILLNAAEAAARDHDCVTMRLEIRKDNASGISLYKKFGYRQFGVHKDYYEDGMDALRFEKKLAPHLQLDMVKVPYYTQTLDFTCGPSALMMAMKALEPSIVMNRRLELRLWRESTTIFMMSGHGGCSPFGLALAARRRGFDVELYANDPGGMFADSVRDPQKKEVIRVVQEDFLHELTQHPVKMQSGPLSVEEIQRQFEQGGMPLVLISSYRIYHEKVPHWVVVTGFDEKYIYVHDPLNHVELGRTPTDCINMPILRTDFQRMARYGKAGQKAVIILRRSESNDEG